MIGRRKPDVPCPCRCGELADRLTQADELLGAIARATVALRPIRPQDSTLAGLMAWGVKEADARLLADAIRRQHI